MASSWLHTLQQAKKTALTQDGKKKVHYTLPDGSELAEEYDLTSKELAVRKWRRSGKLGGQGSWEFEIGEPIYPAGQALQQEGFRESSVNPVLVRRDSRDLFMWRIRNLPYPRDVYSVTVDDEKQQVVVRTSNKKYFKRISIPDIERAGEKLVSSSLTFTHANNTLIVQYKKPRAVIEMEIEVLKEISKLKASEDGDIDCKPS